MTVRIGGVVSNLLKRAPEFVKLNPNATIPVIMDGDFVLWQSNSILRYLANAYAGQNLYPTDANHVPSLTNGLTGKALS